MTISTNDPAVGDPAPIVDDIIDTPEEVGGVFADVLTWLRMLLMPLIVYIIWRAWQPVAEGGINLTLTLLASFLFIIAAATDILDDYFGGTSRSAFRKFGYLDDIADTVLVIGVLTALLFVTGRAGYLSWTFVIPAVVLIAREVTIGLFKGFELSRYGWPDSRLSTAKAALAMFATCLLLASPWLQNWIDTARAGNNVVEVFANASPWVWVAGEVLLWIAAVLSIMTAVRILRTDFSARDND